MKAIIIAAGKGTRLYDAENPQPKVLREAAGRPLLAYALDSAGFIPNDDITIVVGFMKEKVMEAFPERHFAIQGDAAYGTGYAVKCGIDGAELADYEGDLFILQGDVPLIKRETVEKLYETHKRMGNSCTLLSCVTQKKLPFGRIVRNESGNVVGMVEEKDCTPDQKLINELNVGLYVFDAQKLIKALGRLNNNNKAHEYYLTDVPNLLCSDGEKVEAYITEDEDELWGVNTAEDLQMVGDILAARRKKS